MKDEKWDELWIRLRWSVKAESQDRTDEKTAYKGLLDIKVF